MFLFGALFAVGLSFTACSSDNDVAEDNGQIVNGGGNFISISINLPSNPAATTRATDNGGQVTYDDGLDTEYAVNDAMVVIFDKTTNKCKGAYTITPSWDPSSDANVTKTSKQFVKQVDSGVTAGDLLLVVLNANDLFKVQTDNSLKVMKSGTLTAFDGTYNDLINQTNGYLATTTGLDCGEMNKSGFFMANAPLAKYKGSGNEPSDGSVQVLVPISAVYATEDLAKHGTPDKIYVERGMAKVTMNSSSGNFSVSQVSSANDLSYTISAWALDNTNPDSYLVRSTANFSTASTGYWTLSSTKSGATSYRCIGNTAITEGSPSYAYRTYFAESANYSKTATSNTAAGDFSLNTFTLKGEDTNTDNIDDNFTTSFTTPKYCFENTFPVEEQNVSHTTLVQLAVTATYGGSAGNLYTIDGNKSTIYTEATMQTNFANAVIDVIKANKSTYVETDGTYDASDFVIESVTRDATGKVTAVALKKTGTTGTATFKNALYSDATNKIAKTALVNAYITNNTIVQYLGGVSYYHIRIKHFGDNLTPWKDEETPAPSSGNVYPTTNRDNNYLGRYGVLRNNWYDLSVSGISRLGDAVPHTGNWPGTTDDEFDTYITFKINILSWAKRTQSADL